MKKIPIDISDCKTADDFFGVLLSALQAPAWHGHNLDALRDSLIVGDINDISPPFTVEVLGGDRLPEPVVTLLSEVQVIFTEAREQGNVHVEFNIL